MSTHNDGPDHPSARILHYHRRKDDPPPVTVEVSDRRRPERSDRRKDFSQPPEDLRKDQSGTRTYLPPNPQTQSSQKPMPEASGAPCPNGDPRSGNKNDDDTERKNKNDQPEGKKGESEHEEGDKKDEKKPMSPAKKRWLIIGAVVFGVLLITGGILFWLYARQYATTDDAFVDGHVSQISPQVSGRIQSLLIVDNQQVEAGQLLAEIDPRDYEIKLSQAQAQRDQATAQVTLEQANLGQAEANVAVAEADYFQASQDLKRFRAVDPKAITRQQLDNAIANERSMRAKLDSSHQAVDAGHAQVKTAAANAEQAEVAINDAKLQLSYTKITAPIAGRITRRTVEVGNVVASGTPLLAVVSTDLWVTANYKETQLAHMQIGQPVRIKIDAFPNVSFAGHVDSFQKGSGSVFSTLPAENATGNFVKVVQRVPVKIVFDDPSQRDKYPLAPGLSVDPRVKVR